MLNLYVALLTALIAVGASAQAENQSNQQQIDQFRIQQLRIELETERLRAETARIQRETRVSDTKEESLLDTINRRILEEKAGQDKHQEATAMRNEIRLAEVRNSNLIILVVALAVIFVLGIFIAKKSIKEEIMKYEQKFGVLLMVLSVLLIMLAIIVSDNWIEQFDVIQNLMRWLELNFIADSDAGFGKYFISIPTKYALMLLATAFAYGFTTYLEITPAWKIAKNTKNSEKKNKQCRVVN
jgi:hypothetical protein